MNETEFELLGRADGDPWSLAARIVGPQLKLVTVTLGARGAAYVAGAGFRSDPFSWPVRRGDLAAPGPSRSAKVEAERELEAGDPTGCGDVWGATLLARLLGGDSLEEGMKTANRMAARNLQYRGARGLGAFLGGRVNVGGPGS
jgi:sugar/nucleoside kinase (ribokinase family)